MAESGAGTLADLREREEALVASFGPGLGAAHAARLRELGFQEGRRVRCLKTLPFGGPGVFEAGDGVVSLGADAARGVLVRRDGAQGPARGDPG